MKYFGTHVSAAGGVENAPVNAAAIGSKAFAFFTRNQRQWRSPPLTEENISLFRANCEKYGFTAEHILPHASYLINLGHPNPQLVDGARCLFKDEMYRCSRLGLKFMNIHPGNHLGGFSEEKCMKTIAESINIAMGKITSVSVVIENTAGQGSSVGYSFEQLAYIIDRVEDKGRVGVCIDTCHAFAAGYALQTYEECEKTFSDFDRTVGFGYLRGVHLNDSLKAIGSRVDRHADLGEGELGLDVFKYIAGDPRFDDIPLILETPGRDKWPEEIKRLYSFYNHEQ